MAQRRVPKPDEDGVLQAQADGSSSPIDGKDGGPKPPSSRLQVLLSLRPVRVLLLALLVLMVVGFSLGMPSVPQSASTVSPHTLQGSTDEKSNGATTTTIPGSKYKPLSSSSAPPQVIIDYDRLDNCTIRTPTTTDRTEWTTKPLWLASYPNSVEDNLMKGLFSRLTGLGAGAKSFYASNRGLRHCKGKTETAGCLVIHPMVELKPDPTGTQDNFANKYIYMIRNPAMAIPAFLNFKRIKYHKKQGQTPVEDWRYGRDHDSFETMYWPGWKHQLVTWKKLAPHLDVGMYFVFEHLYDVRRGPAMMEKLGELLKSFDFPVAPREDMECVWYQTVGGREALERYEKHPYEHPDYIPGYTQEQKDFMVQQMMEIKEELIADMDIGSILTEYTEHIRDQMPADKEWVNQTETTTTATTAA